MVRDTRSMQDRVQEALHKDTEVLETLRALHGEDLAAVLDALANIVNVSAAFTSSTSDDKLALELGKRMGESTAVLVGALSRLTKVSGEDLFRDLLSLVDVRRVEP